MSVVSPVGTAESYSFATGGKQAVDTPFGVSNSASTYFLQSVTLPVSGLHYQCETNSWVGLTKVTFP